MSLKSRFLVPLLGIVVTLNVIATGMVNEQGPAEADDDWDVTLPRGETREIDFVATEGTWMSVDASPDGAWLVFDLLAHIYRVPVDGGQAECLTQDSGVAVNIHPRYSPDGQTIAFVSDRKGQNNLWLMGADGSNPQAVFTDKSVRVAEPVWTPDGQYIVVSYQRLGTTPQTSPSGIWMFHRDGGEGLELAGRDQPGASWPSLSEDGRYIYFQISERRTLRESDSLKGVRQLRRLDRQTGEIIEVTSGLAQQQYRGSSGGAYAPEVSPDGRQMAFARRIPSGTISYKGHVFGPRTALWVRDLSSGAERMVMDPIEVDAGEGGKILRLLPGYDWSADGESIFISQGGKLGRLDVVSGNIDTVDFTARVHRTISEQAFTTRRLTDDPFRTRFARWQTSSPDGSRLAFQAVGRVWVMDLPDGKAERLTPDSFGPLEYAPAWSPDGQWVAFTSWDDAARGQVWKIADAGGTPQKLSRDAGEYLHPAWSPDGSFLVVTRGSGVTARGRSMVANPWYDLVRIPAEGGAAELVVRPKAQISSSGYRGERFQIVRPSFGPEGRVFYTEFVEPEEGARPATVLVSVRPDGRDRREHLKFPFADEIVPSPDGRWVAFLEGDNVYLTAFPWAGTGGEAPLIQKKKGALPITPLSTGGGLYPGWRNPTTVEFGSGNKYFTYDVGTKETLSAEIVLSVPRDIPKGRLALANARIITLNDRQVIEKGSVVVNGSRIECVGDCDLAGVDRVIDATGKTLIPGLIDMHAHHYAEHRGIQPRHDFEQAIYLAYGVTANLDNSMWSQNVFPTAEMIDAGLVLGPRTFSTGDPIYRGDGSRQNEITSYEVAESAVNRLVSWGAVSIKQYMQPQRDQRQWVTDAARKAGVMVTAEGGDLAYNLSMIMDGHTGWEHPMTYVPLYADVTEFFGRASAVYSPTFVVGGPGPWNEEYFFQDSDLWEDGKLRRWMPWRQLVPHTRRRVMRPESDYSFPLIAQGLADIIASGGYGAIGSHGQQHGIGSHWEVWMAESALGPMGALEVASLHGARFLGLDRDLGSIEAGKLADIVVLNANPLNNIRNTLDIEWVMKGGRLYEGDTLDQVWPERVPFGDYYWLNPDALQQDVRPIG